MGEAIARDTFLANNGVPLIDADNDLNPGNVGGQLTFMSFHATVDATQASTAYLVSGATATQVLMPKAGSIVAISVHGSADVTAGHCTITVFKGATATTLTLDLTTVTGTENDISTWVNKDIHTFAAGELLSVKHKNASLAAASDHSIGLWVEM